MILTKSIIVTGQSVIQADKTRLSDLPVRIDSSVQEELKKLKVKDAKVTVAAVNFPTAASGGNALILITYEGEDKATGKKGGK